MAGGGTDTPLDPFVHSSMRDMVRGSTASAPISERYHLNGKSRNLVILEGLDSGAGGIARA
jgi:hypothetical protein